MLMWIATIFVGFIIDLIVGDPYKIPHPVVFIGKIISLFEKLLRKIIKGKGKIAHLIAGGVEVIFVVFVSTFIPYAILLMAGNVSVVLQFVIASIMCWQILAAKSLKKESMKVYSALRLGDIEQARKNVSMIVGRDTQKLTEQGIIKAAVETVAENTSDGVIAPLFFLFLGGPVAGFAYKAVNTMDSMLGYKNEKYIYFGKAAAKMDDLLNWIPARISALTMIVVCPILNIVAREPQSSYDIKNSYDMKNAYRIWKRDRRKHASPNSAQTETVCAGALGIQLAGDAWYGTVLHKKDYIGDMKREVEEKDIVRANNMMYAATILCLVLFCDISLVLISLF